MKRSPWVWVIYLAIGIPIGLLLASRLDDALRVVFPPNVDWYLRHGYARHEQLRDCGFERDGRDVSKLVFQKASRAVPFPVKSADPSKPPTDAQIDEFMVKTQPFADDPARAQRCGNAQFAQSYFEHKITYNGVTVRPPPGSEP